MNGKNDLATFNINNSSEKFLSKLRLLQEYSIDKEVVTWNDYSQNQQPTNEIQNPQQDSVQTDSSSQTQSSSQTESSSTPVNQSVAVPVKPKTVTLNKGFYFVKSNPATIRPSAIKPAVTNPTTTNNATTKPASRNTTSPTPITNQKQLPTNKNVIIVPAPKTTEKKRTKPKIVQSTITTIPVKNKL